MPIPGTHRTGCDTLVRALALTAARRPDVPFLRAVGEGAPRTFTFGAFAEGVSRAAAFLRASGVTRGERVLLLAENSPEWQLLGYGTGALRAEAVALFAHLAPEQACALARRVNPRVLVVSSPAHLAALAPALPELAARGLRVAVSTGGVIDAASVPAGVRTARADEVLATRAGPSLEALAAEVEAEDPYVLVFTSGTTGRPKGVRVPQRAMVRALEGGWGSTGRLEQDVGLHFLPFGHIAGHDQFAFAVAQGHGLIMVSRRDDIPRGLALGPTYLFSVPLVYERVRDGVRAKIAAKPAPVRGLAQAALAAALRRAQGQGRGAGDAVLAALARRLIGRPLRETLGGRVEGLFAGGAASPPELMRFFEALGIPYVELYGMSETAGLISSNLFHGARRPGSAGHVCSDLEVRVAADGELCVRGGTLMTGYLDAEDEAGAFDEDGFFRTGDLAQLAPDGTLEVVGRKKALLVLSTGKKISPEPVENTLQSVPPVEAAVLTGDGRPFVAAVVFLAQEALRALSTGGQDPERALLARLRPSLESISEYERPKRLLLVPGLPADHPELLTPSLKLKRDEVLRWLAPRLDALYARPATAAG